MIRKAMLMMAILAAAAGPAQAVMPTATVQARAPEVRGEHERFEHFRHFSRPYGYGYTSAPQCYWEKAHWVNHVYPNPYGSYAYVPQYVPGQWVCY